MKHLDFNIPNMAKGTEIPHTVEMQIMKEQQERQDIKRRDRIALYALIISIISMIVSIIALFIKS